jgi:hypothetical protein
VAGLVIGFVTAFVVLPAFDLFGWVGAVIGFVLMLGVVLMTRPVVLRWVRGGSEG